MKSICAMNINIDERVERARNYFLEGYNCAQAVVMAFDDVMAMDVVALARLAAPFGGGMGRMREVWTQRICRSARLTMLLFRPLPSASVARMAILCAAVCWALSLW